MIVDEGMFVALAEDGSGEGSSVLSSALAAGQMIKGTLKHVVDQQAPEVSCSVHDRVARIACLSAYGGLALWSVNRLTVRDDRVGDASLAVVGVGLGVLSGP